MNVKKYFEYSPELELTVAQIGVNKWDWTNINSKNENKAKLIMERNNFDILPICENEKYTQFFQTTTIGDYSRVSIGIIDDHLKIYYRLSFIDLLKKFEKEKRTFYFLVDSEDVLGLITISNLNCLAVYHYIYQITSNLERILSSFIRSYLNQNEVIEILKKTTDKSAKIALKSFIDDKNKNFENNIFQHLYLPTLNTIIKYSEHKLPEKAKQILFYRKEFSSNGLYNKIRNEIAHPIGALFKSHESIFQINKLISDFKIIEELVL